VLYRIDDKGEIHARDGVGRDRAIWNAVVLFKLTRRSMNAARRELLNLRRAAEIHVQQARASEIDMADLPSDSDHPAATLGLAIARRLLFFELFDLEMSSDLWDLVERFRAEIRAVECTWMPASNDGNG